MPPALFLGNAASAAVTDGQRYELPAHHLVTHGVVLGMTGSGKTGLSVVLVEEALRARVPTLVIDLKGDLPNLMLPVRDLTETELTPWVDEEAAARSGRSAAQVAGEIAASLMAGLAGWGLGVADIARLRDEVEPRLLTPGAKIGEPIDVLSSLSRRSTLWDEDEEVARDQLHAGISLLLRLAGRDGDPRSREHIVLGALAERRIASGAAAPLNHLLEDVLAPPMESIGMMAFDEFLPAKDRQALAQDLNALVASPKLGAWLNGAPLDVGEWLRPKAGKTPLVVVSVAHLDDEERLLVLGLLLDEVLAWVRGLSGSSDLRALVVFDEIYGYLPPHPHNPPTKKPLLTLLKQARAFGVGMLLCTQNPMDLDYKALSNAGAWFVGRLQTDADRERVVEGLEGSDGGLGGLSRSDLDATLRNLPPRTFFVRDVHRTPSCALIQVRHALTWLRGPLSRRDMLRLSKALGVRGASPPAAPIAAPGATARVAALPAAATLPATPDGWRSQFFATDQAAIKRYVPLAAATVLLRGRDARLGVVAERQHTIVAPVDATGRADHARATLIDPKALRETPTHPAPFAQLPAGLMTRKIALAVEKTLRELVAARCPIEVLVHKQLGLHCAWNETREAFIERCRVETERRVAEEQPAIVAKARARLAKLEQQRDSAQQEVAAAQQLLQSSPGDLGTALLRVALGSRAVAPRAKERDQAQQKLARATENVIKREAALDAARAEIAAEMDAAAGQMRREAGAVETVRLLPKKGEVEVVGMGVVWWPE